LSDSRQKAGNFLSPFQCKLESCRKGHVESSPQILQHPGHAFPHARSGRVIYYNPASLRMYGFNGQWPELADGEAALIWEVTDLQGRIVPFQNWMHHQVLRGKRFQDVLARVRRKDGKREFWASFNGVPIYDRDGQIAFALITMRENSRGRRTAGHQS
jgi:PAS domain-containing protein